jgi:hypothetical protein
MIIDQGVARSCRFMKNLGLGEHACNERRD